MLERLVAAAAIFLAANFVMSYIIPAPAPSPWWLVFPFGREGAQATWTFGRIDGFPLVLMLAVAGLTVLAFIGAFLATFGIWVAADLWRALVIVGASGSLALFLLHLGPWAVAPLALDLLLLWVALSAVWTPSSAT
ncbi:MAG TPA: hypothetical protein VFV59_04645 [Candidatus Limnocylindria bacterium]|nr:hypothetical protein [Candidatus Limnocylindria bacterium]